MSPARRLPATSSASIVTIITPRVVLSVEDRLGLYDAATQRQRRREPGQPRQPRDWTRADLYTRG